jgi:GDPmannose 4,6-dehydratase
MFRILQLTEASDFVVASGEMHTVREFAQIAFGALGLDWRRHVETDARLLNKILHPLRGDSGKLRAATGWTPSIGFTEMVVGLVDEAARASSAPSQTASPGGISTALRG